MVARSPDFQTLLPLWEGLFGTFPLIMTIGLGELAHELLIGGVFQN